jgi:hypothetical protein
MKSARLRYFNAAGADPAAEIGEDHDPETHLIPLVLDAALVRRPNVTVFGTDYPTPDGTAVRDYVHVEDLAARMSWRSSICLTTATLLPSTSVLVTARRCARSSIRHGVLPGVKSFPAMRLDEQGTRRH